MKDKKVLVVATSQKTRGGITAVLKIYQQAPFWESFHIKWLETHIDRHKIIKFLFAAYALFRYLFLVWRYDLIHIHASEIPSVKRKYLFYKIARLLKKKIVFHLHIGNQIDEKEGNPLYANIFHGSDAIIVLSQLIKKKVVTLFHIEEEKIHVIYNPCPMVSGVNYTPVNKEVLYAGILNHNKGYPILIQAFALLAPRYPDWKVVLAGNGEVKEARQLAKELGVTEQIVLPGWVNKEKKDRLFRRASMLCLSSYAEGFPMAVLDAWAYALPVVTTPVGGLPDVLTDGENAFLFEPGNAEQLAEKMEMLFRDESLRVRMSEESYALAQGPFSLHKISEDISSLYNLLLLEKR